MRIHIEVALQGNEACYNICENIKRMVLDNYSTLSIGQKIHPLDAVDDRTTFLAPKISEILVASAVATSRCTGRREEPLSSIIPINEDTQLSIYIYRPMDSVFESEIHPGDNQDVIYFQTLELPSKSLQGIWEKYVFLFLFFQKINIIIKSHYNACMFLFYRFH